MPRPTRLAARWQALPPGARFAAIALGYVATAEIGVRVATGGSAGGTLAFWAPSGLVLAVLLVAESRNAWLGVLAAAVVGDVAHWLLFDDVSHRTTPLFLAGGVVGWVAAAAGIRFVTDRPWLNRRRGVLALLGIGGVIGPAIGAVVVATGTVLADPEAGWFEAWRAWTLAEGLGVLTVAPLVLAWVAPDPWFRHRWVEGALASAAAGTTAVLVFRFADVPVVYLVLPALVWASLRVGPRGAAGIGAILTLVAAWLTQRGHGPFEAATGAPDALLLLQLYLGVNLGTALLLGAAAAERAAGEATRAERDRMRALLEALQDGLVETDLDGRVLDVNARFLEMVGLGRDEIVGRDGRYPFWPGGSPELVAATAAGLSIDEGARYEIELRRRGGERFPAAVSVSLVRTAGGEPVRMMSIVRDVTDQKRAEQELRASEERYRGVVEVQTDLICRYRPDTTITFVNEALTSFRGLAAEDIVGRRWESMVGERERGRVLAQLEDLGAGRDLVIENRLQDSRGRLRWFQWTVRAVLDAGRPVEYQAVGSDVTERKAAEEALRASEVLNRTVVEALDEGLAVCDDTGRLLRYNDSLLRILGLDAAEVHGAELAHLRLPVVHEDGTLFPPGAHPALVTLRTGQTQHGIVMGVHRPDGTLAWLSVNCYLLSTEGRRGVVASFTDITERKEAETLLVHRSLHDGLTGLPNRILLADRLEHALARTRRIGGQVAVLFCDLDRFKNVNDSFGHDAGDEMLVAVAERFRSIARPGDTVARIGGDEFVVICEGIDGPDAAHAIAKRLHEALEAPIEVNGSLVHVSMSVGINLAGAPADPGALLRDADAAMYLAKERGRGRSEEFSEALRDRAVKRLRVERELRHAIEFGDLVAYYQPIVAIHDRRAVGAEALLRWRHPDRGTLTPVAFLDIAEESGLIVPMGRVVLERACDEIRRRIELGVAATISVNVSATQLAQPDFVRTVSSVLERSGVPPSRLQLEITESVLFEGGSSALKQLFELKSLGLRLGLDDFGTGYSSLTYLKRFPIDFVKIDRGFVAGLDEEGDDAAIVRAIVQLAEALGLAVVAEGVETEAQAEQLRIIGCRFAQGFLFGRPAPALPSGASGRARPSPLGTP
ncbi:MAG: EAL domain-containing protein [Acidimicrobiia bacterium]|nr:EAL domain-containing protein [Acidimicrobiia bacterium]